MPDSARDALLHPVFRSITTFERLNTNSGSRRIKDSEGSNKQQGMGQQSVPSIYDATSVCSDTFGFSLELAPKLLHLLSENK